MLGPFDLDLWDILYDQSHIVNQKLYIHAIFENSFYHFNY